MSTEPFHMPAEWERHEATWLCWPKNPLTFPKDVLQKVEMIYVEMIDALSRGEKVNLLVDDDLVKDKVTSMIRSTTNVSFHKIQTVDVWVRDYGPIFVKNAHEVAATKWVFNAWGNKYDDLLLDNAVGMKIAKEARVKVFEQQMVLEGGSIDVNGSGTLLTTKQCLLNKNRNPNFSQEKISENLSNSLGARNVIWLDSGIAGDDTDGHVDDIARFVSSDTVLCAYSNNTNDENYEALARNYEILVNSQDEKKNQLKVIRLPMPKRRVEYEGGRLPASYSNFYIGNSVVLVPLYEDPNDELALKIIEDSFPSRKVIGIQSTALVFGFGSIHCVTQQQPA